MQHFLDPVPWIEILALRGGVAAQRERVWVSDVKWNFNGASTVKNKADAKKQEVIVTAAEAPPDSGFSARD